MDYWYLIIIIPLILSLINLNHWYFFRTVIANHNAFIKGLSDNSTEEEKKASGEASNWLTSNLTEIKRRIIRSGVNIPVKSVMEPAGYGFVGQGSMNVIDNMLFKNTEVLQQARYTLDLAKGYYLSQAKLCLSPLYWAEVVIYLPRELVKASGIEVTSKLAELILKIVQIIYWIVLIAVSYYGVKP